MTAREVETKPMSKNRRPVPVTILFSAAALVLFVLYFVSLVMGALDWHVQGDAAQVFTVLAESSSYEAFLLNRPHNWWLLAQVWLIGKFGLGLGTPVAAKLMGVLWTLVGVLSLTYVLRKQIRASWMVVGVAVLAFGASAQIMRWGIFSFSSYPANIALGGLVLGGALYFVRRNMQPSPVGAVLVASLFFVACLFSVVNAIAIAAALLAACVVSWSGTGLVSRSRFLVLAFFVGLPAAICCLVQIVLFPHINTGAPPDYAAPLLLGTHAEGHGAIVFLLSRTWMLITNLLHGSRFGAGWLFEVNVILLFAGLILPWFVSRRPDRKFVSLAVVFSLVPVAALSVVSWYPFGWVRYEYFAALPMLVLVGIGCMEFGILMERVVKSPRLIIGLKYAGVSLLVLAAFWNWSWRCDDAIDNYLKNSSGFTESLQVLKANERLPLITDFYSKEVLLLLGVEDNRLYTIPRSFFRRTLDDPDVEFKKLRKALISNSEVGLFNTFGVDRQERTKKFVKVLIDSGFVLESVTPGRLRLERWKRRSPSKLSTRELDTPVTMRGSLKFSRGARLFRSEVSNAMMAELPPAGAIYLKLDGSVHAGALATGTLRFTGLADGLVFQVSRSDNSPYEGSPVVLKTSESGEIEVSCEFDHPHAGIWSVLANRGEDDRLILIAEWQVELRDVSGALVWLDAADPETVMRSRTAAHTHSQQGASE